MLLFYLLISVFVGDLLQILNSLYGFLCEFTDIHRLSSSVYTKNDLPVYMGNAVDLFYLLYNISFSVSTVKRWVLIILWRICERYEPCKMVKKDALLVYLQRRLFLLFYRATALQRGNSFPSCAWRNILFHTRFSWFDHIFTTNSWKNIFVWFSYHILRQRLLVYTTAGMVSGRFILDISFSTWDFR